MYPIPPNETLIETKICRHCQASFPITDKDIEFYDKISPVFDGVKHSIPTPTLCPDCRQQRRLSFRNERKLYRRKCDLTGEDIISIFSPDKPYKVYEQSVWWSDKWDAMDYNPTNGINFDESFFSQFSKLQSQVPRLANNLLDNENTTYCNMCWHLKNCYYCFNLGFTENCLYCNETYHSNDIVDSLDLKNCEIAYQSFFCDKCHNIYYSENCESCSFVYFSYDCKGCNNVFLCSNLRNKNYCIRNKQYTKEEYKKEIQKMLDGKNSTVNDLIKELNNLKIRIIHNQNNNISTESSTGDYLNEVTDCENCFNVYKSQNCKNIYFGDENQKDCYDMDYIAKIEFGYEGTSVSGYKNLFCSLTVNGKNNLYCDLCIECENCFGCIGLKYKQYCILNKQYTREEYEELVPKIIEHMRKTGEWGEFFPSSISPFGYNETVAMEYFPLDRRDVSQKHLYPDEKPIFNWSDYEAPFPKVEKIIPASKLPDDIAKIPDDILNWAIECEVTGKPFRIIRQELEFYRKHNLPIPRRHPDQRHLDRMALRNPRKLFERKCDKCAVDMITTYSMEKKGTVYCESCYNKEVIG